MVLEQIKSAYSKVPPVIRSFLVRALLIFVVWQALYVFVLAPVRIPDRQLTNLTTFSTSRLLSVFYDKVGVIYTNHNKVRTAIVVINNKKVIGVADPCNALEIYVLYIAFLFCFPGTMKRRALFIAGGIPYIFIINTIRCALIAWLNINHRGWVDISHHYIFTAAVYLAIFYLWVLYARQGYDVAGKVTFIVSLLCVLFLSWANVNYFGNNLTNKFSFATNQAVHGIVFIITWFIGYLNWKNNEKWVRWLWSALYLLAAVVFIVISGAGYVAHGNRLLIRYAAEVRNVFSGPLPFLVFFLFLLIITGVTNRLNKPTSR